MSFSSKSKIKNSKSKVVIDLLRSYESRNVTFIEPDGAWPIVWERAQGVHVWDMDGKKYLDLTAAFGVAAAGHANPRVVRAGQKQMAKLLHAMGDVHPHALKARLAQELSQLTFERWQRSEACRVTSDEGQPPVVRAQPSVVTPRAQASWSLFTHHSSLSGKTIFCNSGFEAVEAALKTALLGTGKPGVIAFAGAYHGLGYGALNATHRAHFRSPFRSQLREFGHFVPFPRIGQGSDRSRDRKTQFRNGPAICPSLEVIEARVRRLLRSKRVGAVLVEPLQVRGGIHIPPLEFLPLLRQLCDEHGALLILDEIYTGFGRTGRWFACEHAGVVPDLVCLGKALTGGFPLSACVGRADLMDAAWPLSSGEAIHTSTFLGHPVGCAMALAQIEEIRRGQLVQRSADLGQFLLSLLSTLSPQTSNLSLSVRGMGLLAGVELRRKDDIRATEPTLQTIKSLLHRGFILLPEGEHANVLSFTPPLTISERQLQLTVNALQDVLAADGR